MKFKAKIYVTLRDSVLDPAGTAVQSAIAQIHQNIESVRIGKYIEMNLSAENEAIATQQVNEACDHVLANPVIENFSFELIPL